jgi:phage shock protein A
MLVKADAHGVLEQLEERSLLVKQHLREAEIELDRKRARSEALEEEERNLGDEGSRIRDEIAALDEDVELALSGGKEELARYAVRRLLPKRRALDELARRRSEIADARERLETTLREQEAQFEELKRSARIKLAQQGETPCPEPQAADEEVELELLRRRAGAVGEAS